MIFTVVKYIKIDSNYIFSLDLLLPIRGTPVISLFLNVYKKRLWINVFSANSYTSVFRILSSFICSLYSAENFCLLYASHSMCIASSGWKVLKFFSHLSTLLGGIFLFIASSLFRLKDVSFAIGGRCLSLIVDMYDDSCLVGSAIFSKRICYNSRWFSSFEKYEIETKLFINYIE